MEPTEQPEEPDALLSILAMLREAYGHDRFRVTLEMGEEGHLFLIESCRVIMPSDIATQERKEIG